jgi:hypothetical protein
MATIKDTARQTGVSAGTVSHVLSGAVPVRNTGDQAERERPELGKGGLEGYRNSLGEGGRCSAGTRGDRIAVSPATLLLPPIN